MRTLLFDGSIGDWKTDPISLELKPGSTPYHDKLYPVVVKNNKRFKKEVEHLEKLGVLEKDSDSPWAAPSLGIPIKRTKQK